MKINTENHLALVSTTKAGRWHPEHYKDGDEFVLHLTSEVWITAVLAAGVWYGPGTMEVRPVMVTHWMRLPEVEG